MAISRQARRGPTGRERQRERTREAILDAARDLIRAGEIPTVAEAAEAARVSRATAYRYFPSQGTLLFATYNDVMKVLTAISFDSDDPVERVDQALRSAFEGIVQFEPFMRAALRLALEHWAAERAGHELNEEPLPRGGRRKLINDALSVLEGNMRPARLDRLKATLGLIFGIEGHIVVRDIFDLPDRKALETMRWLARAAVEAALREEAEG